MSVRIHHATAAKARKVGVRLVIDDGDVVALKGDRELARGLQGNLVLDRAIGKLEAAGDIGVLVQREAKRRRRATRDPVDEDFEGGDENGNDANDEVDAAEGEDEESDEPKSVIKKKYKDRYKPHRNTCGDDLRKQIFQHISVLGEGNKKGKRVIDKTKLRRFFNANGCWDPAYANLNVGMQSMNCSNRLRAKIRRDKHVVVWS